MRPHQGKPRVFISSTIYDFADLRSAMKYWLEELGYEVNASEFNDFRKDVSQNSYDACLDQIAASDYFILLIGGRAGGWFDEPAKTSITMAEYRCAYEQARGGRLKLVTLVRQSVWDAREDRRELTRLLKQEYAKDHGLSTDDVERITYHRSRAVTNAETVFAFLDEVGRNAEMHTAAAGKGPRPPGNWIHRFTSFRDVADALRTEFVSAFGMRRVALEANLRVELLENLSQLFHRSDDGQVIPVYFWASAARRQFSGGPEDNSTIVGRDLNNLAVFSVIGMVSQRVRTWALDEALASGEFLEYDRTTDRYTVGAHQQLLIQLRAELDRLSRSENGITSDNRTWMVTNFKPLAGVRRKRAVPNDALVFSMAVHDRQQNIVALSAAIISAIDTGKTVAPELAPVTPFVEIADGLNREQPSADDILLWIHERGWG